MFSLLDPFCLNNTCRICLSAEPTIPIFGTATNNYLGLNEKLNLCFGEKIENLPGYPCSICEPCYMKVNDVVNFINTYKETGKVLEHHLETVVKLEVAEIDHLDDSSNVFECNVEVLNTEEPKILFDDAQELKKFIKPIVDKMKTSSKLIKNKITLTKPIKERLKENKLIKKSSRKVRADSILEGEFIFTGEQWCLSAKQNTKEKAENKTEVNKRINKTIVAKESRKENEPTNIVLKSGLCDVCGESVSKDKLTAHHRTKHSSNAPACTVCSQVLSSHSCLTRHMKTVHCSEKKIICPTCGKNYATTMQLRSHERQVHLKIKPTYKTTHRCTICPKEYTNSESLLRHKRAHSGERPDVCTVCDARFWHKSYLKEHMRLHTGETPFKCPVCTRGYAQRGNMKSHLYHVHKISDLDEITLKSLNPRYLKRMKP